MIDRTIALPVGERLALDDHEDGGSREPRAVIRHNSSANPWAKPSLRGGVPLAAGARRGGLRPESDSAQSGRAALAERNLRLDYRVLRSWPATYVAVALRNGDERGWTAPSLAGVGPSRRPSVRRIPQRSSSHLRQPAPPSFAPVVGSFRSFGLPSPGLPDRPLDPAGIRAVR